MKEENKKKLSLNKRTINVLTKNESAKFAGGVVDPSNGVCNTQEYVTCDCSFPSYSCNQIGGGGCDVTLTPTTPYSCQKPCKTAGV